MAMYSSDGVGHHSASRAKMHEEKIAPAGKPKAAPSKPSSPAHDALSAHSIEDHVGTHGPAVEVHMHHDKATGKHRVTSHHGEGGGEKHHSEHETPEDAHQHMAKAMGLTPPDAGDEKEIDLTPDQEDAEGVSGSGIPGLSR